MPHSVRQSKKRRVMKQMQKLKASGQRLPGGGDYCNLKRSEQIRKRLRNPIYSVYSPNVYEQDTVHNYIIPAKPMRVRGEWPPKPGPIPRSKKEWAICKICTTLFVKKISDTNSVTCREPSCVHQNARENHRNAKQAWRERVGEEAWKKRVNEYARQNRAKKRKPHDCVICGKPYIKLGPTKTCSKECSAINAKNTEKLSKKKYYQKHKQAIKDKVSDWCKKNPERRRANLLRWYNKKKGKKHEA